MNFAGKYEGMCDVCAGIHKESDDSDAKRALRTDMIHALLGAIIFCGIGFFIYYASGAGQSILLPSIRAAPIAFVNIVFGRVGVVVLFAVIVTSILAYAIWVFAKLRSLD